MAGKKNKKAKPEADEPEVAAATEGAEGAEGEAPAKKKMAGKTLVLFIILPALLVLGGGGAAAMMLLGGKKADAVAEDGEHAEKKPPPKKKEEKKKEGGHGEAAAEGHGAPEGEAAAGDAADVGTLTVGEDGDPSFYKMPKILVNLSGPEGDRPLLLQLELVLEGSDPEAFEDVPKSMPRLMDQYQAFLRELRVEDINGSAGSYRLRLELLKRFNLVMAPAKIDAVLIDGMLVQ
jgi:flagellar protein FliL